ncbi:hypothetical protein F1559_004919 [Cyanidiococcus yangmingshanensis]|uniref:Uncharacterized protein n=1 Tax=Cyanidiococcus yangmingshanensis TaxID=2690220 RepID=A0A7J7IS73_9RHOD|nr:hypothetical protein F1559_004919 [Cyanidiococcus yangmingshanensis]
MSVPLMWRINRHWQRWFSATKGAHDSGKKGSSRREEVRPENLEKLATALAPQKVTLEFSEEVLARGAELARAYSKQCLRREAELQRRLVRLARSRDAAVAELPPDQQVLARELDLSVPKRPRWIPTETPPIPNFRRGAVE